MEEKWNWSVVVHTEQELEKGLLQWDSLGPKEEEKQVGHYLSICVQ